MERPVPPPAKTQWFVDPPRGSAKPTCTFDNEEAARRYADECPPHTRIVERPAPPRRHLTGGEREVLHKALLAAIAPDLADALSAVACDRDAAAIRAFGQRVWSDTEDVAYEAGVSDTRARLQEPDVREAVAKALHAFESAHGWFDLEPEEMDYKRRKADAALTKIAEMLK